jgi:hypothetical protein
VSAAMKFLSFAPSATSAAKSRSILSRRASPTNSCQRGDGHYYRGCPANGGRIFATD